VSAPSTVPALRDIRKTYRVALAVNAAALAASGALLWPRLAEVDPQGEYAGFLPMVVAVLFVPGLAVLAIAAATFWRKTIGGVRIALALVGAMWSLSAAALVLSSPS
jgi:hypothetical protein